MTAIEYLKAASKCRTMAERVALAKAYLARGEMGQ